MGGHKRHMKEHDHPVIDWAVDTYKELESAIQDIVSDVPTVPTQWKADAVQDMEGNIPGVRPGKTPYTAYYDYPKRHRYQYETQDQVFDFVAGKVYKVKSNGKCCYADNTDPNTGQPKAMIEIAPTKKAKDTGAVADGENWEQKVNLVVMKETTDWVITAQNTVADWNQALHLVRKVAARPRAKPRMDSMETAKYQQELNLAISAECVSSVALAALKANASGHGQLVKPWMIQPPSAAARSALPPTSCSDLDQ